MEAKSSLPYSQKSVTRTFSTATGSSPHLHNSFSGLILTLTSSSPFPKCFRTNYLEIFHLSFPSFLSHLLDTQSVSKLYATNNDEGQHDTNMTQNSQERRITRVYYVARLVQSASCTKMINVWSWIVEYLTYDFSVVIYLNSYRYKRQTWFFIMVLQHISIRLYGKRWLGGRQPVRGPEWPPLSPDLNPIDC